MRSDLTRNSRANRLFTRVETISVSQVSVCWAEPRAYCGQSPDFSLIYILSFNENIARFAKYTAQKFQTTPPAPFIEIPNSLVTLVFVRYV